jgi:S-DNA-T family DNA segregation ATPase FtsK/SpoIIIE
MSKNKVPARRAGREMRVAVWAARHPQFVATPSLVLASLADLGPVTTGSIAAGALVGGLGWLRAHPDSFHRYAMPRLRSARRRWLSPYAGHRWHAVCMACDLVRLHPHTGETTYPRITRVRAISPSIDRVTVALAPGQSLRTWQDRADELAAMLNADSLGITRVSPRVVALTVVRGNPFDHIVPAVPIPDEPDQVNLSALPLGATEDGGTWCESLTGGNSWLVLGDTGSGKSGLIWNPLRAMGPMIREGLVRVSMVDPKGGMETIQGRQLFHAWADHVEDADDDDSGTDALDMGERSDYQGDSALRVISAFRQRMKDRQADLAASGQRKFTLSRETPFELLMIDEMSMLTAFGSRLAGKALNRMLAEILTQGRANGFVVCGYLHEPTKDIIPVRDLFPCRIALRTASASYVDMVLGEDARARGALADEIPAGEDYAGIGFRVDRRHRNPVRVRAGYVTDTEIAELVRTCAPVAEPATVHEFAPRVVA